MWIKLLSEEFRRIAPKDRDIDIFFLPIKKVENYYKQPTKLIECSNCSFFWNKCWTRDKKLFDCSKGEKRIIWISEEELRIRRKRFLRMFTLKKIGELQKRRL